MALLLVVSMIAILSVVIIRFGRSMQLAVTDAYRYQNRVVLESTAHSGIDIGMALLQIDLQESEFDSFLEKWALLEEDPLDLGMEQADLTIAIKDLGGRFPINSLVAMAQEGQNQGQNTDGMNPELAREMLLRLLQSDLFAVEDELEAREIVDSLTDWIDADDDELDYGAESSYYDSLEKPLVPRNGPVDFIDELLQVKGISRDLLYGNSETQPLVEYISVENKSGKININTAPVALIQALDERITEEETEGLDEYRRDEANIDALKDTSWFSGYLPGDIGGSDLQRILTTRSSHFMVESQASYQDRLMTIRAIIERLSENETRLVSLRVD